MDAQGRGEANDVLQRKVALAALHAAHVGTMNTRFGGQSFLAEAGLLAQSADTLTEAVQNLVTHCDGSFRP